jgi:hypothetical protein
VFHNPAWVNDVGRALAKLRLRKRYTLRGVDVWLRTSFFSPVLLIGAGSFRGRSLLKGGARRAVLATLLPARRPRYSARKVKCATSRYLNRDDGRPAHPAAITAIDIAICTPPVDLKPGRTHRDRGAPRRPRLLRPATRRERITAIITSQPPRDWSGHELAVLLDVKPRNMLAQLGEWARLGFFTRTGFGTCKLNTPPADTPSTIPPDP